MTKQRNWTPKSPSETCAATYESLVKALDGLPSKFEIPEAVREFLMRSAATAKDRSTDLHAGVNKVTGAFEEALVSAVNGTADLNRKIVDAISGRRGGLYCSRKAGWRQVTHRGLSVVRRVCAPNSAS